MEFKRPWYVVLEVSKDANEKEVKEAYRKVVMKNNYNDPNAKQDVEKNAMEIIEAYKHWKEYVKPKKIYDDTEEGRRQRAIDEVLKRIDDDYVILYKVALDYGYADIRKYLEDAYNHRALNVVYSDIEKCKNFLNRNKNVMQESSVKENRGSSFSRASQILRTKTAEIQDNINKRSIEDCINMLKIYNNLNRVRNVAKLLNFNTETDFLMYLIEIDELFIIENFYAIDPDYSIDIEIFKYYSRLLNNKKQK